MAKGKYWHVSGWAAVLLAPLALPLALLAQLLPKKTRDLSAAEVATVLRNFIAGKDGEWDWDDFESIPITDPMLDQIRKEAAMAGPPDADLVKLAELLQRTEGLMLLSK